MQELLKKGLRELGLDTEKAETLAHFAALMLAKNAVINLRLVEKSDRLYQ